MYLYTDRDRLAPEFCPFDFTLILMWIFKTAVVRKWWFVFVKALKETQKPSHISSLFPVVDIGCRVSAYVSLWINQRRYGKHTHTHIYIYIYYTQLNVGSIVHKWEWESKVCAFTALWLSTYFLIDVSTKVKERPKLILDMVVVVVYVLISDDTSLVPFVAISMTCIHFTTHFP